MHQALSDTDDHDSMVGLGVMVLFIKYSLGFIMEVNSS